MRFKKNELLEIIDGNGDLIGNNDVPTVDANADSQASNTTDYNAKVGTQPFRYDMLGRFGFTLMPFMEGKEEQADTFFSELTGLMHSRFVDITDYYIKHPNLLKPDNRKAKEETVGHNEECEKRDIKWAKEIMKLVDKHFGKKTEKQIDEGISIKKPITFKSNKNELFYITFKFDDNGRLSGVDNKWDISFPDWWGLDVPENMIIDYFRKKYPDFYLVDDTINESLFVDEDKMMDKKSEDEISKKVVDTDIKDKKLQKVAGLINKLDKKDIDKLINLLERK